MKVRIERFSWTDQEMKSDDRGDFVYYGDYQSELDRVTELEELLNQVNGALDDMRDTLDSLIKDTRL